MKRWPLKIKVGVYSAALTMLTLVVGAVALMTFILIISSVTMVLAVEADHRMDKKGVIKWLFLTVLSGALFVGSQAWEWSHFNHGGGGYMSTENGAKYWVHTDEHYTHDPASKESFALVPAMSGHYLIADTLPGGAQEAHARR